MKQLRIIRIALAAIFLISAVAYLVLDFEKNPLALISLHTQIAQTTLAAGIGVSLVWLVITLFMGRIYCSTVCPLGTIIDIFALLPSLAMRRRRRYRPRPRRKYSIHIMFITVICSVLGVSIVTWVIEPWNICANIASIVNSNAIEDSWLTLGIGSAYGAIIGAAVGVLSLAAIGTYAALSGRSFCTDICPMGTALGLLHEHNIYHIELNPDRCTYCGLCEERCASGCINLTERNVDNSRCVRCFDCVAVCPENAIRYQANRNRPASPLMRKRKDIIRN